MIRELVATLDEIPGAQVEFVKDEDGIVVADCHLPNLPNILVRFNGSSAVLEWYLIIRDARTGHEVFSDWMDYTGYGETDMEKLRTDMRRDIEWVLADIRRATSFRLSSKKLWWFLREKEPEWCIDGRWRRALIYDPNR